MERIKERYFTSKAGREIRRILDDVELVMIHLGLTWDDINVVDGDYLSLYALLLDWKGDGASFLKMYGSFQPSQEEQDDVELKNLKQLAVLFARKILDDSEELQALATYLQAWSDAQLSNSCTPPVVLRVLQAQYPYRGDVYRGGDSYPSHLINSFSKDREVAENYAGHSDSLKEHQGFPPNPDGRVYTDRARLKRGLDYEGMLKSLAPFNMTIEELHNSYYWEQEVVMLPNKHNPFRRVERYILPKYLDTPYGQEAQRILDEVNAKLDRLGMVDYPEWDLYFSYERDVLALYYNILYYEGEPEKLFNTWSELTFDGTHHARAITLNHLCSMIYYFDEQCPTESYELAVALSIWLEELTGKYRRGAHLLFRVLAKAYPATGTIYRGIALKAPYVESKLVSSYSTSLEVAENFAGLSQTLVYRDGLNQPPWGEPKLITLDEYEGVNITELIDRLAVFEPISSRYQRRNGWEKEVVVVPPMGSENIDGVKTVYLFTRSTEYEYGI